MVQAAAGALLPILSGAAGALGSQSRRDRPARIPRESSTMAIAAAPNNKAAKLALKNAREDRLYDLLSQPEVLGFVMTFAGITAAQMIPFSEDKVANESIQAIATSSAVLMGLGYAGVGDLTTTIMAGLAGAASLTGLAKDAAEGLGEGLAEGIWAPFKGLSNLASDIVSAPFKGLETLFGG